MVALIDCIVLYFCSCFLFSFFFFWVWVWLFVLDEYMRKEGILAKWSGVEWTGVEWMAGVLFFFPFFLLSPFLSACVCMYDVCVCALHAYVCFWFDLTWSGFGLFGSSRKLVDILISQLYAHNNRDDTTTVQLLSWKKYRVVCLCMGNTTLIRKKPWKNNQQPKNTKTRCPLPPSITDAYS